MRALVCILLTTLCGVAHAGEEPETPKSQIRLTYSPRVVDGAADSDWNGGSIPGSGTILDLHRFLGYNELSSYRFEFSHLVTSKDRLTFAYEYMEAETEWCTRGELWFDHIIVPANTDVRSSLLLQRLTVQYSRRLLDANKFRVWAGAGVEHLHLRFQLEDLDGKQSDVEDVNDAWSPYVALEATMALSDKASVTLSATKSIPVSINDITQDNFSWGAEVAYSLTSSLALTLGYRWDMMDIEDKNEDAPGTNCYQVNSDGITLGLVLKF